MLPKNIPLCSLLVNYVELFSDINDGSGLALGATPPLTRRLKVQILSQTISSSKRSRNRKCKEFNLHYSMK